MNSESEEMVRKFISGELPTSQIEEHFEFLVARKYQKTFWLGVAKLITSQRTDLLESHAVSLMRWMQDRSWPGAELIYQRLLDFGPVVLRKALDQAKAEAEKNLDKDWCENLECLHEDFFGHLDQ